MKSYFYTAAAFVLTFSSFASAQDELLESIRRIGAAVKSDVSFDPAEYLTISEHAIRNWSAASPDDKARFSMRMFHVHFRRAQIFANSGNFKVAKDELISEALLQKEFGGQLEYARSDVFFENLIELQALVTAETGSDPLADKVNYSFQKEGDGFTAARLELGDDVAGVTVPEIKSEEALALVHRISRQGGRFVASAPKWFVVPKGTLPDVLKQATREVKFDSTGKMTVQNLQAGGNTESTITNIDSATASSRLPPVVQPPTPTKAHDVKLPILSKEPVSSTQWSIIVVLVVVVIGLLWLLLKKRK